MSKKTKLFKDLHDLRNEEVYNEFIEEDLLPLGFDEKGDEVFYQIKRQLFEALYDLSKNGGASFDPEIYFNSIISDLSETFDVVCPTLTLLQRDK